MTHKNGGSKMSVGGKIVEVLDTEDSYWVNTYDDHVECAVYIDKEGGKEPQVGDTLWWQGRKAYWTPQPHTDGDPFDIAIPKISGSGVNRPRPEEIVNVV